MAWYRTIRSLRWFLPVLVALPAVPAGHLVAQDSVRVDVSIEGIDGALRKNVELVFELARRAEEGKIASWQLRGLHQRAETDIATALQPFGYYRPRVRGSLERDGERWKARYLIDPGPAVRLTGVALTLSGEGERAPEFVAAVKDFPVRAGDTLQHLRYEAAKLALLTLASDSGYLDADIDTSVIKVNRGAGTAEVLIRFHVGPRFRFGEVRFDQKVLDERLLRSRIPFHRGDLFRQDRLLALQTALAEDPYWERVEVTPRREEANADREVPIDIVLVPRKASTFDLGLGYGTDTGPRGTVTATLRRLTRYGHNAQGNITLSPLEQSIRGELNIPAFGNPTGIFTLFGGFSRLDPTSSDSRTLRAGARLLRRRTGWSQTMSLTYNREAFDVGVDSGLANLSILNVSFERSASDDATYPRRGFRLRLSAQGSRQGILSSSSFGQLQGSAKVVRALGGSTRVLARAEAGYTATSAFRSLPPSVRFFTGGDQSVRGFAYQGLGSLDSLGNVIGGRALRVASLELDRQLFGRWGVAAFADWGNASDRFTLGGLERSAGGGLRFLSPVGMIRVDAAWVFSRSGNPFRIHFSIGPDL